MNHPTQVFSQLSWGAFHKRFILEGRAGRRLLRARHPWRLYWRLNKSGLMFGCLCCKSSQAQAACHRFPWAHHYFGEELWPSSGLFDFRKNRSNLSPARPLVDPWVSYATSPLRRASSTVPVMNTCSPPAFAWTWPWDACFRRHDFRDQQTTPSTMCSNISRRTTLGQRNPCSCTEPRVPGRPLNALPIRQDSLNTSLANARNRACGLLQRHAWARGSRSYLLSSLGGGEETFLCFLWDIRNAGASPRQVVCFNLEGPGSHAADRVSSWRWLLEVSEPNLWPTPSKWIKVYGMFILY